MKEVYDTYFPDLDLPLIVSFAAHLRNFGYSIKVSYDLYDLLVYNGADEPVMGVLSTRIAPAPNEMKSLLGDETQEKVVLVENPEDLVHDLAMNKLFLAAGDVSVFLNGYGWAHKRGDNLKLDHRDWKFQGLRRYSKREDGEWVKECVFCKEKKTVDHYYKRHQWGGRVRDPYRNVCKDCWKERYYKKA